MKLKLPLLGTIDFVHGSLELQSCVALRDEVCWHMYMANVALTTESPLETVSLHVLILLWTCLAKHRHFESKRFATVFQCIRLKTCF